jgi:hypothetical protein
VCQAGRDERRNGECADARAGEFPAGRPTLIPLEELTEQLEQARDLGSAADVLARFSVDHLQAEEAGVSIHERPGESWRLGDASRLLTVLDRHARLLGEGPSVALVAEDDVVSVPDTANDPLWPAWTAVATTRSIRSVLIVGMPAVRHRSVTLELFSHRPNAFSAEGLVEARKTARLAGLSFRHIDRIDNLEAAMHTRALIGQAQGILMQRYDMSGAQAIAYLRRLSQNSHVKVRDLAAQLVASMDREPE